MKRNIKKIITMLSLALTLNIVGGSTLFGMQEEKILT